MNWTICICISKTLGNRQASPWKTPMFRYHWVFSSREHLQESFGSIDTVTSLCAQHPCPLLSQMIGTHHESWSLPQETSLETILCVESWKSPGLSIFSHFILVAKSTCSVGSCRFPLHLLFFPAINHYVCINDTFCMLWGLILCITAVWTDDPGSPFQDHEGLALHRGYCVCQATYIHVFVKPHT